MYPTLSIIAESTRKIVKADTTIKHHRHASTAWILICPNLMNIVVDILRFEASASGLLQFRFRTAGFSCEKKYVVAENKENV
jgi:hypothetical protein